MSEKDIRLAVSIQEPNVRISIEKAVPDIRMTVSRAAKDIRIAVERAERQISLAVNRGGQYFPEYEGPLLIPVQKPDAGDGARFWHVDPRQPRAGHLGPAEGNGHLGRNDDRFRACLRLPENSIKERKSNGKNTYSRAE